MRTINVGIVGTGWCGGIRAETCAASPYVRDLHLAEIKEPRLKEVADKTGAISATSDYRHSARKRKHRCRDHFGDSGDHALSDGEGKPSDRGKHVFLEKPIALELSEADELIALARTQEICCLPLDIRSASTLSSPM